MNFLPSDDGIIGGLDRGGLDRGGLDRGELNRGGSDGGVDGPRTGEGFGLDVLAIFLVILLGISDSRSSNAKREASCSATFLFLAVAVVKTLLLGSITPIVKIRSCDGPTTAISAYFGG